MRTRELVRMLVVAIFGLINPRVAGSQLPTDVQKQMWSAQWITSPEGPQRDQSVLHFRKFIELAQQPERRLRVAQLADRQAAARNTRVSASIHSVSTGSPPW